MCWTGFNDCGATAEGVDALLLACDPSIRLDDKQWGDGHVLNGFDSKVVLNAKYLPGSLEDAVNRLMEMKQLYSLRRYMEIANKAADTYGEPLRAHLRSPPPFGEKIK